MRGDDFAFPWIEFNGEGDKIYRQHPGLTKREYIATEVMKSYVTLGTINSWNDKDHAYRAVQVADSMIEALNEKE